MQAYLRATIPQSDGVTFTNIPPEFGSKVVRFFISKNAPVKLAQKLRLGLKQINSLTSFVYDLVDNGPNDNMESESFPPGPSIGRSEINKGLDVLRWIMGKEKCRFRNGRVYQLVEGSTYTFAPV